MAYYVLKAKRFSCLYQPLRVGVFMGIDNISLTIVQLPGQNNRHLPALTVVQIRILELLDLSEDVYNRLAYN